MRGICSRNCMPLESNDALTHSHHKTDNRVTDGLLPLSCNASHVDQQGEAPKWQFSLDSTNTLTCPYRTSGETQKFLWVLPSKGNLKNDCKHVVRRTVTSTLASIVWTWPMFLGSVTVLLCCVSVCVAQPAICSLSFGSLSKFEDKA